MARAAVLEEIDVLKRRVLELRAHFPHLGPECEGTQVIGPPAYYVHHGIAMMRQFSHPITLDDIATFNGLGRWVNESAIVRLVALLKAYRILGETTRINWDLQDACHVDIARRLRNVILKEAGEYKPSDAEHVKLLDAMSQAYGVERPLDSYPVPIDLVIIPMIDGVRRYVSEWLEQSRA